MAAPKVVNNNYSPGVGMVSRRAIISRSRDDLQHHLGVNNKNFTGEDQWFSKEKLYKVCCDLCSVLMAHILIILVKHLTDS